MSEHPPGCRCEGLDRLCPVRYRRSEVEVRHEQALARSRELEKRLREGRS